MELAAVSILRRAVEMDEKEQYTMALMLYQEGVQILLDVVKGNTHIISIPVLIFVNQYIYIYLHLFNKSQYNYVSLIKSHRDKGSLQERSLYH